MKEPSKGEKKIKGLHFTFQGKWLGFKKKKKKQNHEI